VCTALISIQAQPFSRTKLEKRDQQERARRLAEKREMEQREERERQKQEKATKDRNYWDQHSLWLLPLAVMFPRCTLLFFTNFTVNASWKTWIFWLVAPRTFLQSPCLLQAYLCSTHKNKTLLWLGVRWIIGQRTQFSFCVHGYVFGAVNSQKRDFFSLCCHEASDETWCWLTLFHLCSWYPLGLEHKVTTDWLSFINREERKD
jgi:hypothetical protein